MQRAMPPWPRVPFRPDNGGRAGAVDNHDYVKDFSKLYHRSSLASVHYAVSLVNRHFLNSLK